MENILTLGKLLSLWFCFLLHSILFLISQTSYRTYKIISSYELARPVMGNIFLVNIYIYSRRQYKVSVTYLLPTVPYFKKKRLARPYRFILLGMTQYYCYARSEYRAESTFKCIFLLCLYRCCSSRLFLTRPFRSSLSIVSALFVY